MKYKRIGVICAMESEAKRILSALTERREEKVGSLTFFCGKIGKREVILSVCGIGKVFAALCAQTMILTFAPDALYNSGVAGSLTEKMEILHVAVSDKLVQHDMDTSPLGDPVGLISGINLVYLPADPLLRQAAMAFAHKMGIPTLEGTVASGDRFIATKAEKDRIKDAFDPIACEMEGAAIAQVAYVNETPFAVIRAISDSADEGGAMDYLEFLPIAAKNSSLLTEYLIENY